MNNEEKIKEIESVIYGLDITTEAYGINMYSVVEDSIKFLQEYIHLLKLEQEYCDD